MAAPPPARHAELIANDLRYIAATTVLHLPVQRLGMQRRRRSELRRRRRFAGRPMAG